MNLDWQLAAAAGIVAVAGGYLARRGWLALRGDRAGGCGSCGSCRRGDATAPAAGEPKVLPLVPLESLGKPGRSK